MERHKTTQDKVSVRECSSQAANILQVFSLGFLSPPAAGDASKELARGIPRESTASDQGILTVSELSPEIPPLPD